MPFQSKAQQRFMYANKAKMKAKGVDVDEWSEKTDFSKIPDKAKKEAVFATGPFISGLTGLGPVEQAAYAMPGVHGLVLGAASEVPGSPVKAYDKFMNKHVAPLFGSHGLGKKLRSYLTGEQQKTGFSKIPDKVKKKAKTASVIGQLLMRLGLKKPQASAKTDMAKGTLAGAGAGFTVGALSGLLRPKQLAARALAGGVGGGLIGAGAGLAKNKLSKKADDGEGGSIPRGLGYGLLGSLGVMVPAGLANKALLHGATGPAVTKANGKFDKDLIRKLAPQLGVEDLAFEYNPKQVGAAVPKGMAGYTRNTILHGDKTNLGIGLHELGHLSKKGRIIHPRYTHMLGRGIAPMLANIFGARVGNSLAKGKDTSIVDKVGLGAGVLGSVPMLAEEGRATFLAKRLAKANKLGKIKGLKRALGTYGAGAIAPALLGLAAGAGYGLGTKKSSDQLPGGLADSEPDSKYDPDELDEGTKVEKEHTGSKAKAKEIAKDHLEELPDYYTRLDEMEEEGKKELGMNAEKKAAIDALKCIVCGQPIKGHDKAKCKRVRDGEEEKQAASSCKQTHSMSQGPKRPKKRSRGDLDGMAGNAAAGKMAEFAAHDEIVYPEPLAKLAYHLCLLGPTMADRAADRAFEKQAKLGLFSALGKIFKRAPKTTAVATRGSSLPAAAQKATAGAKGPIDVPFEIVKEPAAKAGKSTLQKARAYLNALGIAGGAGFATGAGYAATKNSED